MAGDTLVLTIYFPFPDVSLQHIADVIVKLEEIEYAKYFKIILVTKIMWSVFLCFTYIHTHTVYFVMLPR